MMKLIKVKDYAEMSERAASIVSDKVRKSPSIVLGLATGGTPEGMYANLVKDYQQNKTSYQQVTTFNLDEYVGLDGSHPNSYRFYMNEHLFNQININKENTFVPRGNTANNEAECLAYEALIESQGGIDLQVLGIGGNGHIGFNEPGTSFLTTTHIVSLTESTKAANARYFSRVEEVPEQAITMGINTIMNSKEILLLISGESKHDALRKLLEGEVSEAFPASILQNHPSVTIIADEAAVGELNRQGDVHKVL